MGVVLGMRSALQQMRLDRRGATAVEYAMVALFVSIAAFSAIATIGTNVTSIFSQIATSF
jgi:pilus assembly protein Flp/PilA